MSIEVTELTPGGYSAYVKLLPDGDNIVYLCSSPSDTPYTCLWEIDSAKVNTKGWFLERKNPEYSNPDHCFSSLRPLLLCLPIREITKAEFLAYFL